MFGEFSLGWILVLLLVLAAEFVNGWSDAPNAIATVVSTRVLSLRKAVLLATLLNMVGALTGTAVAATIGKELLNRQSSIFQPLELQWLLLSHGVPLRGGSACQPVSPTRSFRVWQGQA